MGGMGGDVLINLVKKITNITLFSTLNIQPYTVALLIFFLI